MFILVLLICTGLGAVVGWFVFALSYLVIAPLFGATDFEGALSVGAVFAVGPVGAVVGAGLGCWAGFKLYKSIDYGLLRKWSISFVVVCVFLAVGTYLFQQLTDGDPYDLSKPRPRILFEIRYPFNGAAPSADQLKAKMITHKTFTWGHWIKANFRSEKNQTIVTGEALVFWRVKNRRIEFWHVSDSFHHQFDLMLESDLKPTNEFGPWIPASYLIDPTSRSPNSVPENDQYFIRTKIEMNAR